MGGRALWLRPSLCWLKKEVIMKIIDFLKIIDLKKILLVLVLLAGGMESGYGMWFFPKKKRIKSKIDDLKDNHPDIANLYLYFEKAMKNFDEKSNDFEELSEEFIEETFRLFSENTTFGDKLISDYLICFRIQPDSDDSQNLRRIKSETDDQVALEVNEIIDTTKSELVSRINPKEVLLEGFIEIANKLIYSSYIKQIKKNISPWLKQQIKKKIAGIKNVTDSFSLPNPVLTHLSIPVTKIITAQLEEGIDTTTYNPYKPSYYFNNDLDAFLNNARVAYGTMEVQQIYFFAQILKALRSESDSLLSPDEEQNLINFYRNKTDHLSLRNRKNKFYIWQNETKKYFKKTKKNYREFISQEPEFLIILSEAKQTYERELNAILKGLFYKSRSKLTKKLQSAREILEKENIFLAISDDRTIPITIIPSQQWHPAPDIPKVEKEEEVVEKAEEALTQKNKPPLPPKKNRPPSIQWKKTAKEKTKIQEKIKFYEEFMNTQQKQPENPKLQKRQQQLPQPHERFHHERIGSIPEY